MIVDDIAKTGKVLILGYGREGQSTEQFLRSRCPQLKIEIADQARDKQYLKKIIGHTWVIKSPGIPPHLKEIEAAKKRGVRFTSATQIFFEVCPAQIIGVTGTKGKSTTASLIHHLLKTAGVPAVLVGNIGQPALDQLVEIDLNTKVVFELSSHQLMDLTQSPTVAVLLNIVPEHLDYYANFEEYQAAKFRITQFQSKKDLLVYVAKNPELAQTVEQLSGAGMRLPLTSEVIAAGPWSKLTPKENPLKGTFNWENIAAAWTAAAHLGLTDEQIRHGLSTYRPLEGRLELVEGRAFGGIFFYDDRLATIPEAAVAALQTVGSTVQTMFLGGSDRKQDFTQLAEVVVDSGVRNVILFPETGKRIWKSIQKANTTGRDIQSFNVESMDEAVRLAYQYTSPGKAVLMSNASPSFGLFKDYRDKAEQYLKAIKKYLPPTTTAAAKPTTGKTATA